MAQTDIHPIVCFTRKAQNKDVRPHCPDGLGWHGKRLELVLMDQLHE